MDPDFVFCLMESMKLVDALPIVIAFIFGWGVVFVVIVLLFFFRRRQSPNGDDSK